jgi:hypothetical protein
MKRRFVSPGSVGEGTETVSEGFDRDKPSETLKSVVA